MVDKLGHSYMTQYSYKGKGEQLDKEVNFEQSWDRQGS